jgi:hypothetical protein
MGAIDDQRGDEAAVHCGEDKRASRARETSSD